VGNPFEQYPARRSKLIQRTSAGPETGERKIPQVGVGNNAGQLLGRFRRSGTPDVNIFSRFGQGLREQVNVVSDSSEPGWIFRSEDVPLGVQASAARIVSRFSVIQPSSSLIPCSTLVLGCHPS